MFDDSFNGRDIDIHAYDFRRGREHVAAERHIRIDQFLKAPVMFYGTPIRDRMTRDELQIKSPNTDQFYTCFEKVDERVPRAFAQAFRDASSKSGYIDYKSPTDIRSTIMGNNYFKLELKRKAGE